MLQSEVTGSAEKHHEVDERESAEKSKSHAARGENWRARAIGSAALDGGVQINMAGIPPVWSERRPKSTPSNLKFDRSLAIRTTISVAFAGCAADRRWTASRTPCRWRSC